MRKIFLAIAIPLLILDAVACSSTAPGPIDYPTPEAGAGDAQPPPLDAGTDATLPDSGADAAPEPDANPPTDAGADGEVRDGSTDGGIDCAALLAKMMSAPVTPPGGWFGLDIENGGKGLTIDQADILACASSVEPDVLEAGVTPFQAGARTAFFGEDGGTLSVSYTLDSRDIWFVKANPPATTTLTFHARAGGAYDRGAPDGGTSVYVFGIGANANEDAGLGYVTKDGKDFPPDWTLSSDDAGLPHASAWANELYDGLMATYAPTVPPVPDCLDAPILRPNGLERVSACLFVPTPQGSYFGARTLGLYAAFAGETNQPTSIYELWAGASPSCATPGAAVDALLNTAPYIRGNSDPAIGPIWSGLSIGTLVASEPISNSGGMLASEANRIAGCGGVNVAPPDPGYAAEQWGPKGEVELEYNLDSGVAYKLYAKPGFPGALDIVNYENDGGANEYLIGATTLSGNGMPVTLDWASGDAGTLNAAITDISNAWLEGFCGIEDTDCVQAGDCQIVPDDGHGHSTFTLQLSPALVGSCFDPHPLTVVFAKGPSSNVPTELYATNPGGQ